MFYQAYPSGVSDENVQLLGSVSRVASLDDISRWNITKIDTLAALMKSEDGSWEAEKVKNRRITKHQILNLKICYTYYYERYFAELKSFLTCCSEQSNHHQVSEYFWELPGQH